MTYPFYKAEIPSGEATAAFADWYSNRYCQGFDPSLVASEYVTGGNVQVDAFQCLCCIKL